MIEEFGHKLIERGYEIVPIWPNKKYPCIDDWQNSPGSAADVDVWAKKYPQCGIGILGRSTVAVDIDCQNKELNNEIIGWLKAKTGHLYIRTGSAPKCLMPFRVDAPMRKVKSATYLDSSGVAHALEILGDGQQWVSYGVHPNGNDYEWKYPKNITLSDIYHDDLPLLTPNLVTELISLFEQKAVSRGWAAQGKGSGNAVLCSDSLASLKPVMDVDDHGVNEILARFPNDEMHYDEWIKVGMSLHHQYQGEEEGLEKWVEWSEDSQKYEVGACEKKWSSFGEYEGSPVTLATLKFEGVKVESAEVVEEELPKMLGAWAGVQVEGCFRVIREDINKDHVVLYRTEDLKKEFQNKKVLDYQGDKPKLVNLVDLWLDDSLRRTFPAGLTFAPDKVTPHHYNLWRGWSYTPKKGNVEPWLEFVRTVIAADNADHAKYIVDWCAQLVQRPRQKIGVGLVVKGGKGGGKTKFGEMLGGLFSAHHKIVSKAEHVTGKFNKHLEDTLLLQCDEAYWAKNKAAEGALKDLLTNPRITVERKGVDSYSSDNYTRLLFTSNEDFVVPASFDERRFAVFEISMIRQQDTEYFSKLHNWYKFGGAEALLHYLMNYDLTNATPEAAPKTTALDEQKVESMNSIDQWLLSSLEAGQMEEQRHDGENLDFGEDQPKMRVYQVYSGSCKGRYDVPSKENTFWKHLHRIEGLIAGESRKRHNGNQVRMVQFTHVDFARNAFAEYHRLGPQIWRTSTAADPLDPDNWMEVPF